LGATVRVIATWRNTISLGEPAGKGIGSSIIGAQQGRARAGGHGLGRKGIEGKFLLGVKGWPKNPETGEYQRRAGGENAAVLTEIHYTST